MTTATRTGTDTVATPRRLGHPGFGYLEARSESSPQIWLNLDINNNPPPSLPMRSAVQNGAAVATRGERGTFLEVCRQVEKCRVGENRSAGK